jgi:hypothetical protein
MILRSKMLHPPIGGDFRGLVVAAAVGVFSILQSRKKTAKMAAGGSNKISTPQTNWPFFLISFYL